MDLETLAKLSDAAGVLVSTRETVNRKKITGMLELLTPEQKKKVLEPFSGEEILGNDDNMKYRCVPDPDDVNKYKVQKTQFDRRSWL